MALKLISAPAALAVSLEDAKRHLRVDHTDDDTLITLMLKAAIGHAEKFMGRALIDQTWELSLDAFPTNEVRLPKPPLIGVVSVIYDDGAGDPVTLDPGAYTVDTASEPGWVVPGSSWPGTFDGINAARIRYRAGYVDHESSPEGEVPADIQAAILLMLGTLYANRETIVIGQTAVSLPWSSEQLLRPHRVEMSLA